MTSRGGGSTACVRCGDSAKFGDQLMYRVANGDAVCMKCLGGLAEEWHAQVASSRAAPKCARCGERRASGMPVCSDCDRLGDYGSSALSDDVDRLWARVRALEEKR